MGTGNTERLSPTSPPALFRRFQRSGDAAADLLAAGWDFRDRADVVLRTVCVGHGPLGECQGLAAHPGFRGRRRFSALASVPAASSKSASTLSKAG